MSDNLPDNNVNGTNGFAMENTWTPPVENLYPSNNSANGYPRNITYGGDEFPMPPLHNSDQYTVEQSHYQQTINEAYGQAVNSELGYQMHSQPIADGTPHQVSPNSTSNPEDFQEFGEDQMDSEVCENGK